MSEDEACVDGDFTPEVPTSLLERVCDLLKPGSVEARASLADSLRSSAVRYLEDRNCPLALANPKEQRANLRQLRGAIESSYRYIQRIAPEYEVALDAPIHPSSERVVENARAALQQLNRSISVFDEHFQPPTSRPADLPLEQAVRDLFWTVEDVIGEFPQPKLNKHADCRPQLESRGARAIGMLLMGIDPALNETKVANMIEAVRLGRPRNIDSLEALFEFQTLAAAGVFEPSEAPND